MHSYLLVVKRVHSYLLVLKRVHSYLLVLKRVHSYLLVVKRVHSYLLVLKRVHSYLLVVKSALLYSCSKECTITCWVQSAIDTAKGSIIFVPEALNTYSTNGPRLRLFLTTDDLNKIKQNTSLYTAMANTYLNLDEGFVLDLNNNPLEPAINVIALNFTEDMGSPMLTSFDFDLNEGLLSLLFSETVNASSFNPSGITIQSVHNATIATDQYTLTGGLLTSLVDSTILTLQVTTVDLDIIKARGIALENVTTWLTMTSNTVLDMRDC